MPNQARCLAVVRVRGTINVRGGVKDTLKMLHLTRPNHATLIPSTSNYRGMLQRAKDYITWGEISSETLLKLLIKRGRRVGGEKLTEEYVKEQGYRSLQDFSKKLHSLELKLTGIKSVKPVFRLHPPSAGYKRTVKRGYAEGGELGYRGESINQLIERMM